MILFNGYFWTVDSKNPVAEAVAIRGNHILAVGDSALVFRLRANHTKTINLEGRFACPGFNDSHMHLLQGAKELDEVDFSDVHSFREMQNLILKTVRHLPPGAWLVGKGWDQNHLTDELWPDYRVLDAVAPHVPMFLMRSCGHVVLVNNKALNIAGIDNETPNPPGGIIERDRRGRATGILKEEAIQLVRQYLPAQETRQIKENLRTLIAQIPQYGITSIQDCSGSETIRLYSDLFSKSGLPCRLSESFELSGDMETVREYQHNIKLPLMRFGLLKGSVDGNVGSRTAAFFEPYADNRDCRGLAIISQEELNQQVVLADAHGYQIGIHAIGDLATHMALNAFELAQGINGKKERRHRIEHAQVIAPSDFHRFKDLNMVVSMQPAHCIEDLRWIDLSIGRERCRYAYAWRSLYESGNTLAFGSDWPYATMNPLVGIYAAATRRDETGFPLQGWIPKERLSVEAAIEAYTLGAAYAEYAEKEKGSLEAGKFADIVILDRNLLKITPEEILTTSVVCTILDGSVVYQQDTFECP